MNINLVIFDWSGVISDDRRPVYEANVRVLKDHDRQPLTFENFLKTATMGPSEWFASCGIPGNAHELLSIYKRYFDEVNKAGILPSIYLMQKKFWSI